jgi:hypothetical protein
MSDIKQRKYLFISPFEMIGSRCQGEKNIYDFCRCIFPFLSNQLKYGEPHILEKERQEINGKFFILRNKCKIVFNHLKSLDN